MDEFKFQSVLADDFLEFFLDYFPELKRRRVDSIPGEQRSRPTASRWSWRVGSGPRLGGAEVRPLGAAFWGRPRGPGSVPQEELAHPLAPFPHSALLPLSVLWSPHPWTHVVRPLALPRPAPAPRGSCLGSA